MESILHVFSVWWHVPLLGYLEGVMYLITEETAMVHNTVLLTARHSLNISKIEEDGSMLCHTIEILLKN